MSHLQFSNNSTLPAMGTEEENNFLPEHLAQASLPSTESRSQQDRGPQKIPSQKAETERHRRERMNDGLDALRESKILEIFVGKPLRSLPRDQLVQQTANCLKLMEVMGEQPSSHSPDPEMWFDFNVTYYQSNNYAGWEPTVSPFN